MWDMGITYLEVVDEDFAEAIREHVAGLAVATVTDVWHQVLPLETPTHPVVDTFRFTPVTLHKRRNIKSAVRFLVIRLICV